MDKNQTVYYARSVPNCNIFEVCELVVRTVAPTYCTGYDVKTKQAFCFSQEDPNIFDSYLDAINYMRERKEDTK